MRIDLTADVAAVADLITSELALDRAASGAVAVVHISDPLGGAARVSLGSGTTLLASSLRDGSVDLGMVRAWSDRAYALTDYWFGDLKPDSNGRVTIEVVLDDGLSQTVDLAAESELGECFLRFLERAAVRARDVESNAEAWAGAVVLAFADGQPASLLAP